MRIFPFAILLVHALVVSKMAHGAAVDRYESKRQQPTVIINLLDPTGDRKVEEESRSNVATTVKHGNEGEEEDDEYYYYDEEYDNGMSGDIELVFPRVAMSSRPKDPLSTPKVESTEGNKRGKGKKKGKGKGKKRNPCLKKYKDFCIHGTCQYLRDLHAPSCVCHPNYSGERCQFITLPTQSRVGYSRTTALAVVAVVLSSICLTIIGLLLMLRFHKRGAYDVENEEKAKVGLTSNH